MQHTFMFPRLCTHENRHLHLDMPFEGLAATQFVLCASHMYLGPFLFIFLFARFVLSMFMPPMHVRACLHLRAGTHFSSMV